MLKVEKLTKKYGKVTAADNISFTVEDGSAAILLGPNGAGKSTVIKSAAGLLRYSGTITVNGFDNKGLDAKAIMGYVPEIPSLYPNLTVGEHMEFIARAYKLKDYKTYKQELLARFEIDDKIKKFGDELSKGMQQKLSICCALLPRPKVILFDEPMIGLDPHAIKELKNLIVQLRGEGAAVLISTHMIDSVDMLWDKTVIMKGGTVAAQIIRDKIEGSGQSLEDIFFNITEEGEAKPQ